ncbi:hypothetical protein [Streptomyces sp. NBC_01171]|uniref:hypothetical protein n=1 Tax=Streptomyces sp. NBC_01171 TaxID=2903757 RepID=UPI00386E58E3|nr:hypothetical protein OG448_11665 [Streptomyces sp. NBC_01171]
MHRNQPGRPPRDELTRHLKGIGEAPFEDGDACSLFAGHDPGHSWEMRDLLHD